MPSRERRGAIGVMGPFGYGNLGDAAIVEALLQKLRLQYPDREIRGFTLDPDDTRRRHGIVSHPLSRMSWKEDRESGGPYRRFVRRLESSRLPVARTLHRVGARLPAEFGMLARAYRSLGDVDTLIVCGSGQLQDYWGGGGAWSYPYTMLRWGLLARLRRTSFVVLSVGAGPVAGRLSRRFFRWVLSLASYRSYRDEWSRRFVIDEIGFDATDDPVVPDLAFGLAWSAPSQRFEPPPGRVVGVGPIGYFREGTWPEVDSERGERHLRTMVDLTEGIIRDGHSVLFLKGEAEYDQRMIDDMRAELESRDATLLDDVIETRIEEVEDLLAALRRCDAVVASRYHNVLLAYLLGIPVLGISYQAKTDSLMEEFGQLDFCLPIADLDATVASERVAALLAQVDFADVAERIVEVKRDALEAQYAQLRSAL